MNLFVITAVIAPTLACSGGGCRQPSCGGFSNMGAMMMPVGVVYMPVGMAYMPMGGSYMPIGGVSMPTGGGYTPVRYTGVSTGGGYISQPAAAPKGGGYAVGGKGKR
uniref:Uncharacterized protein n=2 Tax=Parascaris TaxID=6254 RepID=A0A915BUG3_PARUN